MARLKLVLVVGPSGTGKSTLAKKIAKELGFTHIDSEKIKQQFDYQPDVTQKSQARKKSYRALYYQVLTKLKIGHNVVTDAPHNQEMKDPTFVAELERKMAEWGVDADIKIIHRTASRSQIRQNIRWRWKTQGRPQDLQKLENWQAFVDGELKPYRVVHDHLVVRNRHDQINEIRRFIHAE